MVEMFDRLYTRRLFSFPGFFRSYCISTIITVVYLYEIGRLELPPMSMGIVGLWSNVLSDYVSLFVVRRWLLVAGQRPLSALLAGPIVGGLVVLLSYLIVYGFFRFSNTLRSDSDFALILIKYGPWEWLVENPTAVWPYAPAAIAVHLWLPLFALGVLFVQLVNSFVLAVAKMQWFLKRGQQHPLQAIGYVAAAVVFIGTIAGQTMLKWIA